MNFQAGSNDKMGTMTFNNEDFGTNGKTKQLYKMYRYSN